MEGVIPPPFLSQKKTLNNMKEVSHGFLGNYKTYKKVGFKEEVPLTPQQKQQEILNKMKPWVYDPEKIKVKYGFVGGEPGPEPPPVETFYLLTAEGDELQTAELDNLLWTI